MEDMNLNPDNNPPTVNDVTVGVGVGAAAGSGTGGVSAESPVSVATGSEEAVVAAVVPNDDAVAVVLQPIPQDTQPPPQEQDHQGQQSVQVSTVAPESNTNAVAAAAGTGTSTTTGTLGALQHHSSSSLASSPLASLIRQDPMHILSSMKPEDSSSSLLFESGYPILFKGVRGFAERRNDVIYYPPDKSKAHPSSSSSSITEVDGIDYGGETGEKVLIFFGGDIQDLHANMLNSKLVQYSLESTASLLHSQLPSHHILIIRPSVFKHGTYSSYDNFVPCSHNNSGIPEHTANHNALPHLEMILRETSRLFNNGGEVEVDGHVSSTTTDIDLAGGRLCLVGFSKGSVVLNQFLYEFHYYKTLHPETPPPFMSTIRHIFWLDGGHSGGKNTWITARPILDTLSRLNLSIHVHMTPYQLNDERRQYIRNEEKSFGLTLGKLGKEIDRRIWFEGEQSLDAHFALLHEVFKRQQ